MLAITLSLAVAITFMPTMSFAEGAEFIEPQLAEIEEAEEAVEPEETTTTEEAITPEENMIIEESSAIWDGNTPEEKPDTFVEDGTEITINDAKALAWFASTVNSGTSYHDKIVTLGADIDLNNQEWTPIGNATNRFRGTFKGNQKTIKNLLITGTNIEVGLFGFVAYGKIMGVTIDGAEVTGNDKVGTLVGTMYPDEETATEVIISDCHVKNAVITANYKRAAGIVGNFSTDTASANIEMQLVNNSVENTKIFALGTTNAGEAGGIVAQIWNDSMTEILVKGNHVAHVTIEANSKYFGGIVGRMRNNIAETTIVVEDCHVNDLKLKATDGAAFFAGGIAGGLWSAGMAPNYVIKDCTVSNSNLELDGGLADGDGPISGLGGIIGYLNYGGISITGCKITNTKLEGKNYIGGIIGFAAADGGELVVSDNVLSKINSIATIEGGKKWDFYGYGDARGAQLGTNNILEVIWDGTTTDVKWYGDGTSDSFQINTAAELAGLATIVKGTKEGPAVDFKGKTVTLGADIDLNNQEWTPIGTKEAPFCGTFDGANQKVSNLKITKQQMTSSSQETTNEAKNLGLFGYVNGGGKLSNVSIETVEITGIESMGALVGAIVGPIENVHIKDATINGTHWGGGIAGYAYSHVKNCTVDNVAVKLSFDTGLSDNGDKAGGILGFQGEGNFLVENCTSQNIVIEGVRDVGGLVGSTNNGVQYKNCKVESGRILAKEDLGGTHEKPYAGGVIGRVAAPSITLSNCNTTNVTVESYMDGFAGDFVGGPSENWSICKIVNTTTGESYETIQAAVVAATNFDTISLAAGVYEIAGPISVNKSLTFLGSGEDTIMKSTIDNQYVFAISNGAGSVHFKNMKIDASQGGMLLIGSEASTKLEGVKVAGQVDTTSKIGIKIDPSVVVPKLEILNCQFENLDNAIYGGDTYSNETGKIEEFIVRGSTFKNNNRGFYTERHDRAIIENTLFDGNKRIGFSICIPSNMNELVIKDNVFKNNGDETANSGAFALDLVGNKTYFNPDDTVQKTIGDVVVSSVTITGNSGEGNSKENGFIYQIVDSNHNTVTTETINNNGTLNTVKRENIFNTVANGAQLRSILSQAKEGDTIKVAYGNHDLGSVSASENKALIEVVQNNLTILGIPNELGEKPLLYSKDTLGSAMKNQNFIVIRGKGVTVDGLKLMPKWNTATISGTTGIYANKVVEIYGANGTVQNCEIAPNDKIDFDGKTLIYDSKKTDGGMIVLNKANGAKLVNNVFTNGAIKLEGDYDYKDAEFEITGNTFFGGNNTFKSYHLLQTPYAFAVNENANRATVHFNKNKIMQGEEGVSIKNAANFTVDGSLNYWGEAPNFTKIISGNITISPYYIDEAMTKTDGLIEQDKFTVTNNQELDKAILRIADGGTILLKANEEPYHQISLYKKNVSIIGETGVKIAGITAYGAGAVFKDLTSTEDIVIMPSVGVGTVKLQNVTIEEGNILDVRGGEKSTVLLAGTSILPTVQIGKKINQKETRQVNATQANAERVSVVVGEEANVASMDIFAGGQVEIHGQPVTNILVNTTDRASISGNVTNLTMERGNLLVQQGSQIKVTTMEGGTASLKGAMETLTIAGGEATIFGNTGTVTTTGGETIVSGSAETFIARKTASVQTSVGSKIKTLGISDTATATVGGVIDSLTVNEGTATTEKTATVSTLAAIGGVCNISGKVEHASIIEGTVTLNSGANIAKAEMIGTGSIEGTDTDATIGKIEVMVEDASVKTAATIIVVDLQGYSSEDIAKDRDNILNIVGAKIAEENKNTATATFQLNNANVNQKDGTFSVDLVLANAPQGVAGFQVVVGYGNLLEYVTYKETTGLDGNTIVTEEDGNIKITRVSAENAVNEDILATIQFTVNQDKYLEQSISDAMTLTVASGNTSYIPSNQIEDTQIISDAHVFVVNGTVVIVPRTLLLGDVNDSGTLTTADVIDILREINRGDKIFTEWKMAAANVVLSGGEEIISQPTAIDARAILEAIHYGKTIAERVSREGETK